MRLDDPTLGSTAPVARDAGFVQAVRQQIAFVRARVPFWGDRLAKAAVDVHKIERLSMPLPK